MAYISQTLYTNLENISLSYVDLLNILGLEIPDEIQNAAADTAFNAVIRTQEQVRSLGLTTIKHFNSLNYTRVSVNGTLLRTISEAGSLALYNITSLNIDFPGISEGDSVEFLISVAYNNTLYDLFLTLSYDSIFVSTSAVNAAETSDIHSWFIYFDNYSSEHYINVALSEPEYSDYVFVNTYSITTLNEMIRQSYNTENAASAGILFHGKTAMLYVDPRCVKPFTITVTINRVSIRTFYYHPARINISGMQYKRAPQMNSQNMSYGLLRTNPKLTGNIKLVVDSNSDLYLDTFKVSETLQQKRFRRIKVGYSDYYGDDVMTKFKTVPSSEMYKVNDDCFNMFTTVQSYKSQYYDMYNYGVKTNDDLLYSENFAFLAPLCIKRDVPDFFLIFKIHKESIDERTMSDEELISYFLTNGTLVKSYDMRLGSKIGTYIRTIRDKASEKIGDIYISYDTRSYTRYNGISLDRGTVTSLYESPVLQNYVNNQVALNDFYTLGFERNRLLSKDIINFEFMFNDTEEDLFSINTYFGIYVKVNEQDESFSCIGRTYDASRDSYIYQFDKEVNTFPIGTTLSNNDTYAKLIYGLTTPTEFIRLNGSIIDEPIMEQYMMVPYSNLLSLKVNEIEDTTAKGFIYFQQKSVLVPGDHIRFIDEENSVVYEIIASNEDSLKSYNAYGLSEVTSHFKDDLGSIDMSFYRQSFYAHDEATIEEQIEIIQQALFAFNEYAENEIFHVTKKSNDTLSVLSKSSDMSFEFLCSISLMDTDLISLEEYTEKDNTFYFFNSFYSEKCILNILDSWEGSNHILFYPIDFDFVGSRIAYIVKFMQTSPDEGNYYMIDSSTALNLLESNTLMYKQTTGSSVLQLYTPMSYVYYSSNGINFSENTIQTYYLPCYNIREARLITLISPVITNNEINFYTIIPLNSGICSILQIKDFDFEVLDNVSILSRSSNIGHNIGDAGEFSKESYYGAPLLNYPEEYIQNYFDKYTKVDSSTLLDDINAFNNFTYSCIQNNTQKSSISLISPYVCKWRSIGTDARGEGLRIMSEDSSLKDSNSFYIPYLQYTEDLGYIYQRDSSIFYDKHIPKNIEQMSYDSSNGSEDSNIGITEKDSILYGDARIDDIMYDASSMKNKFSLTVKTGSNTIEFISGGIKFRIKSNNSNALDLEDCVGYEATFVNVPSSDTNIYPLELIIDKVNEQILLSMYDFYQTPIEENGFNVIKLDGLNSFTNIYTSEDEGGGILYANKELGELSSEQSALFAVTMKDDADSYYKMSKVAITGALETHIDEETGTITNGYIYSDDSSMVLAAEAYKQHATRNLEPVNYYILTTQDAPIIDHENQNIEKLNNSLNNCAIYVKTAYGVDDLTHLENILTITTVNPIVSDRNENTTKYVHPTHIVPIMKDMLSFDYIPVVDEVFESSDDDSYEMLEDIFRYSFDGANIVLRNTNVIPQIWFNKYTEETNFCIGDTSLYKMSLDLINDKSIMKSCWDNSMFFNYNSSDNGRETKTSIDGYAAGFEIKSFFASKGINLNGANGKQIELTNWQNTEISLSNRYIRLNISDTLMNDILFRTAFNNYWTYLRLTNNNYKIQYINNVILPLIHISNNTKFTFYKGTEQLNSYQFSSNFDESIPEISNIRNELRYENNKYYMYIYPEETGMYYAKMIIKL